jgi:hypothetical protein
LSLGAPHEVIDKSGKKCLAFDVAVNTQVIEDCKQDKTGAFRNFVCELAIQYIDQKVCFDVSIMVKLHGMNSLSIVQNSIGCSL